MSGDRSSVLRKRALRRASHEHYLAYSALYEQAMSETPGLTRYQARGRAWTAVLGISSQTGTSSCSRSNRAVSAPKRRPIPAASPGSARAVGWLTSAGRPTGLDFAEFRAQGMASSKAYDRAVAAVRDDNAGVFTRLLAEEYQRWLAASGAGAPAGGSGPAKAAAVQ